MAKFYVPTKISENIRETPEGFLLCLNVPIARTGWMDYAEEETPLKGKDGIVKIHRESNEVFSPKTIASFEAKAITIRHPQDFVNPDNWNYLAKGVTQNVRKGAEKDEDGEESLYADLLITDAMAIQLVKNGLREVSCGYEAEYEQTGDGEGRQVNIVGNHVALVEQGRAGEAYAITDDKGKVTQMEKSIIEKLKAKLGAKVVDEAMAEEKKESKDEEAKSYDELVKMVKDLGEKIDGMKPAAKDEEKKPEEKKEEASKDEDGSKMEERLKALETAVAKLLDGKSKDEDEEESMDDMDESEDEDDMAGGEESTDEDEEADKKKKTGDEKRKEKKTGLEGTKKVEDAKKRAEAFDSNSSKETMTPEKLNELHAAHWARK